MSIQLVIKSPNQEDDISIDCKVTWTIEEIKDYLASNYPTKIEKKEQKIIYCGKLLQNHLVLDKVLNKSLEVQTMHLVCPQSTCNNKKNVTSKKKEQCDQLVNTKLETEISVPSNQQPDIPHHNTSNSTSIQSYAHTYPDPTYFNSQMLLMQQYYSQAMSHYITQYSESTQRYLNVSRQSEQNDPPPEQPNENNQAEDEDFVAADFLDIALVCLETAVLLAVLLHSTTVGILSAIGIALFFRLCHAWRTYFTNMTQRQTNNNNVSQNSEFDDLPSSEETILHTSTSRNNGFKVAFTFVRTLFTSLIPE